MQHTIKISRLVIKNLPLAEDEDIAAKDTKDKDGEGIISLLVQGSRKEQR